MNLVSAMCIRPALISMSFPGTLVGAMHQIFQGYVLQLGCSIACTGLQTGAPGGFAGIVYSARLAATSVFTCEHAKCTKHSHLPTSVRLVRCCASNLVPWGVAKVRLGPKAARHGGGHMKGIAGSFPGVGLRCGQLTVCGCLPSTQLYP